MNKIQFYALLLAKFAQKYLRKQRFLFIMGVGLLLLAIIIKQTNFVIIRPTVSEGIVGIYTNQNLPSPVTSLLSNSLVSLDPSGQPKPNLVTGWQVSNDAKTYTFKLKQGLTWNDGSRVLSTDIKFKIPDVDTTYPDNETIQFKLADSFSPFPTLLTQPIFKQDTLVGLGKYNIFRKEQSRSVITKIIATPKDTQNRNLPTISIRFYPDEKTAKTAFSLGEVDALMGYSGQAAEFGQKQVLEKKLPTANKLFAIFYNTKDNILSDKNLRKALSFETPAIEGEEKAKGPIPPTSWAFNSEVRQYLDNHESAKSYLDKANMGKDTTITLTTTPPFASLGEKIIAAWKNLGIAAVMRVESGVPQNFQALLITEMIPSDPDQYSLWHSTQTNTNLSHYSSPRVDKDLEDGRKSADLEVRKEKYADFQRVLLEDAPATFLYFPKTNIIYRQRIGKDLDQILNLQFPTVTKT